MSASQHRPLRPSIGGVAVPAWVERNGRETFRRLGAATSRWRPPPHFLVAGGKRCGSTSFYFHLLAHPDVLPMFPSARYLPKKRDGKGPHFFDQHFARGPAWYLGHFPSSVARARHARRTGQRPLAGEGSPYSLHHPLAAARAHALLPELKVLFVLRDPVRRTHSHWREQTRNGVETLNFEAALDAEAERVGDDDLLLAQGVIERSFAHENQSYAAQSEYARGIGRWLAQYPAAQVRVLFSEDYFADPAGSMAGVHEFLGLRPFDAGRAPKLNAAPASDLAPGVEARLRERFAPHDAALSEALGRPLPWPTGAV